LPRREDLRPQDRVRPHPLAHRGVGRPHGRRHGSPRGRAQVLGRRLRLQDRRERDPGPLRLVGSGPHRRTTFLGLPMNPMSEQEFQDYLRQANWFMRGQIDENRKAFQLDSYHRFDWDQWRGELVFSSAGTPKVVGKIQLVGSHSTKSNAWMWAWANTSYLASIRQAVLRAKEFGTERGIIRLIQPRWAAKESDAWEMTAMTSKLAEAKGA